MSSSHAALAAASDDRKARLAKLKTLKRKQPADEVVAPESTRSASPPAVTTSSDAVVDTASHDVARLHLSGRNYDAEARGAKLGFSAPPTLGLAGPTLEEQAAAVAREAEARAAADDARIDLFKLQPRKPNWDLKRDLDRKLDVLNVRTDNAIARLVRERIAGAQAVAQKKKKGASGNGNGNGDKEGTEQGQEQGQGDGDGEAAGMDGVALVEGLRVREREEEEEERKEREEQEADDDV
ncbi:cwf18 pre-mRNA splicing factor-domain-containing protein [Biscogniauxia sp. FL1348]|nr:cwf18 pre-mRNA splicing factor-domain-containing protein [Biscogniauxia sp. FL1348]